MARPSLGAAASRPEDVITNGDVSGWATTLLGRLRIAEHAMPTGGPLWVVGRYYGSSLFSTNTSAAVTASRLYLTPFYAPRVRNIDRISINVTTAGTAGQVARVGIYNADPTTGMPAAVLIDGGTLSVATTGAKEATVTQAIHGLVWLAVTAQGGTLTAFNNAMIPTIVGATAVTNLGALVVVGKDTVDPTVALPTMVGATLAYGQTSTPPAVVVRAA